MGYFPNQWENKRIALVVIVGPPHEGVERFAYAAALAVRLKHFKTIINPSMVGVFAEGGQAWSGNQYG
jgi:hypothetical protein